QADARARLKAAPDEAARDRIASRVIFRVADLPRLVRIAQIDNREMAVVAKAAADAAEIPDDAGHGITSTFPKTRRPSSSATPSAARASGNRVSMIGFRPPDDTCFRQAPMSSGT